MSTFPPLRYMYLNFTSTYCSQGLAAAINPDPVTGLYTNNASAPLEQRLGLRMIYKFGLYSHCAYVNDTAGTCSNSSTANRFEPFTVITADMSANFSGIADALVTSTTFTDSQYLGNFSNGAYYLLLIGTICAALALITYASPPSSVSDKL